LAVIGVLNSAISLYYYIRVAVSWPAGRDGRGVFIFSPSLAA
jgi:NADH:ubiquinone oxidoreductase subunit 2 (subunit N)